MLASVMRIVLAVVVLLVLGVVVSVAWLLMRGPTAVEAGQIAAVLESTAAPGEPASYAHCASCHLHDGSGRPDGSIPRLNGQRRAVLENKLHRLRIGNLRMPVMDPYARSLTAGDVGEIARYLSDLPETNAAPTEATAAEQAQAASRYAEHCAACHGANGEGQDGLFASRLCGQYAGYLSRRLTEVAERTRGDADAVMQGVVDLVPAEDLRLIVAWLAAGQGCQSP
jgi:cytochrome c553